MACGMQPAWATTLLRPRGLPSPRRCAAGAGAKGQLHQVGCMQNFHWKMHLSTAESGRFKSPAISCTGSGSSTGAATFSSRPPPNGSRGCVDDPVPGLNCIVISGYWTGPDMDDGCGHVQAILQRIA